MIGIQIFSDHSSQRFTLMAIVEFNEGGMYRARWPGEYATIWPCSGSCNYGMYPGPC
jgi:hypothetical protein